jgi:hypothetical protein
MQAEIGRDGASSLEVSVFTREEGMSEYYKPGVVYQGHPHDDEYPEMEFTPAQARELAAALRRAADEAEGRKPVGAERDLLDFIDRAGWDGTALVASHRQYVRDEVAGELETMDGTNLGMSLTCSQAVNVARRGLTPWDTQHGN